MSCLLKALFIVLLLRRIERYFRVGVLLGLPRCLSVSHVVYDRPFTSPSPLPAPNSEILCTSIQIINTEMNNRQQTYSAYSGFSDSPLQANESCFFLPEFGGDDEGGHKPCANQQTKIQGLPENPLSDNGLNRLAQGKPPLEPAIGSAQFHHPSLCLLPICSGSFLHFCKPVVFLLSRFRVML
jgi:hypothetical protein